MVVRVNGGVITDQTLTGSLRFFELALVGAFANTIGDTGIAIYGQVADGGTGYTVGDTLTVVGGTGTAATFNVSAISGGGGTGPATNVTLTTAGAYTVLPTNPVATTGGTGSGATLNVDFASDVIIPGASVGTYGITEEYVGFNSPVVGSAADQALSVVAERASIVQIAVIDDDTIQIACENTGFGWETVDGSGSSPTDMELAVQALGVVDVPDNTATGTTVDLSTVAIVEKFFSSGLV